MQVRKPPVADSSQSCSLSVRNFLESVLAERNLNLQKPADRHRLAEGWGSVHVDWLVRLLNGEIDWIPPLHLNAIEVLLRLEPPQDGILERINQQSYYDSSRCRDD